MGWVVGISPIDYVVNGKLSSRENLWLGTLDTNVVETFVIIQNYTYTIEFLKNKYSYIKFHTVPEARILFRFIRKASQIAYAYFVVE